MDDFRPPGPKGTGPPDAIWEQWNLLDTFTLNFRVSPMVALSKQANGRVVADAVESATRARACDNIEFHKVRGNRDYRKSTSAQCWVILALGKYP